MKDELKGVAPPTDAPPTDGPLGPYFFVVPDYFLDAMLAAFPGCRVVPISETYLPLEQETNEV